MKLYYIYVIIEITTVGSIEIHLKLFYYGKCTLIIIQYEKYTITAKYWKPNLYL